MPEQPEPGEPEVKFLRVYLRDLVLPVRIGIYGQEEAAQTVRFDVTAEIDAPSGGVTSLDDTLSYDLIRDIVVAVVAEGHVELAETSPKLSRAASSLSARPCA